MLLNMAVSKSSTRKNMKRWETTSMTASLPNAGGIHGLPDAASSSGPVVTRSARSTRYTITDEGSGFGWNGFLTRSDEPCDSRVANGRGVFLAKAFFPDLTYNERGTEVTFSVPLP